MREIRDSIYWVLEKYHPVVRVMENVDNEAVRNILHQLQSAIQKLHQIYEESGSEKKLQYMRAIRIKYMSTQGEISTTKIADSLAVGISTAYRYVKKGCEELGRYLEDETIHEIQALERKYA